MFLSSFLSRIMTQLRPGKYTFLLRFDSCLLIESPHKDPLAAIDHYLNTPDSKAVNIHITEAASNKSIVRKVQLTRPSGAAAEPLDNLVRLDDYRRGHNTLA